MSTPHAAPTPKQREELEALDVVREELALHKGDILSDFVARRRGADRAEDVDRRARRILSRLRTHSPEEPEMPSFNCPTCRQEWADDRHRLRGRRGLSKYKCDRCGTWFRVLDDGTTERTHGASPEEPVGEEEAVALAKSYGYVVIHRSAWEFIRDDPHPERRNWNSSHRPTPRRGSDG